MPVLKVKKNGVWETVAGGVSSAETLIVEIDVDNETASHTPSEIAAAVENGKVVVARGKSSLLFDGTIFNLFEANETRAVFEYTRSTLADVDTYRYEIDADKKATLTLYSLDIGPLSDLTTTNKESIVKAINEVAANGGSGESNVLVVTADTATMTASHSKTEIEEAATAGKAVILCADGGNFGTYAPGNGFMFTQAANSEAITVYVDIDDNKKVTVDQDIYPFVPNCFRGDAGKVLTVDESLSPVWKQPDGVASSTIDLEPVEDENGTGVKITVDNRAADGTVSQETYTVYNGKDGTGGSGESELFLVTIDATNMKSSHSYDEIMAAGASGKVVLAVFGGNAMHLVGESSSQGEVRALFGATILVGTVTSTQHHIRLEVDNNKNIYVEMDEGIIVPAPTSSDYGKVLSATADGLVWNEQSGESNVLLVTFTTDQGVTESVINGTASHTFNEIKAAHEAGKLVFLYNQAEGGYIPLEHVYDDYAYFGTAFGEAYGEDAYVHATSYEIYADGTCKWYVGNGFNIPDGTVEEIELINETVTSEFQSDLGAYAALISYSRIEVPSTVNVIVDGVEYKYLPIIDIPSLGSCAGNLSMLNPMGFNYADTGESFIVGVGTNAALFTANLAQSETHDLKLSIVNADVTKTLAPEYLASEPQPGKGLVIGQNGMEWGYPTPPLIDLVELGFVVQYDFGIQEEISEEVYNKILSAAKSGTVRLRFLVEKYADDGSVESSYTMIGTANANIGYADDDIAIWLSFICRDNQFVFRVSKITDGAIIIGEHYAGQLYDLAPDSVACVTFTKDSNGNYTCSHTVSQIKGFLDNGMQVIGREKISNAGDWLISQIFMHCDYEVGTVGYMFSGSYEAVQNGIAGVFSKLYIVNTLTDGTEKCDVTEGQYFMSTVPIIAPTEEDVGKVLSYTGNVIEWVVPSGGSTVPSAKGVEF